MLLQDCDYVTQANLSTSLLTETASIGNRKTRVGAAWLERRGFSTSILERRLSAGFLREASDPRLLICGVDNSETRRLLDEVGFPLVLEAGLGAGVGDFMKFRTHAFTGDGRAKRLFPEALEAAEVPSTPAYQALLARTQDRCGLVTVAGAAVGVPFMGLLVGALLAGEAIRVASGDDPRAVITGSATDTAGIRSEKLGGACAFNVGYIE